MTVPSMYNFRSLSNKFPTIFWSLIFRISLSRLSYFSKKKETQNFRIRKCDGKRNQKTSHFLKTLNCISNFRENNITEALVISKRLKFP